MRLLNLLLLLCLIALTPVAQAAKVDINKVTPRPAPELALEMLDGSTLDPGDLDGKTIIVNFWATWCAPCRKEMPALQTAWEELRDENVVLIAISVGEGRAAVAKYVKEMGLDFPIALDPTTDHSMAWAVRGLPATYIVDPAGRIVMEATGERDWDNSAMLNQIRSVAH